MTSPEKISIRTTVSCGSENLFDVDPAMLGTRILQSIQFQSFII